MTICGMFERGGAEVGRTKYTFLHTITCDVAIANRPYLSFAEPSHSDETFVVVYWHYARNDGAGYANLTAVVHKLEKDIGVIEKLCNYKVSTSIDLQRNCRLRMKLYKWECFAQPVYRDATGHIITEDFMQDHAQVINQQK
jgi:capsid protein